MRMKRVEIRIVMRGRANQNLCGKRGVARGGVGINPIDDTTVVVACLAQRVVKSRMRGLRVGNFVLDGMVGAGEIERQKEVVVA